MQCFKFFCSFQQRNLKQRFIALLKRFKDPEAFEQDQELDPRTGRYGVFSFIA